MSPLTEAPRGVLDAIVGDRESAATLVARRLAAAIASNPSPYLFHVCAPHDICQQFDATVKRILGYRRSSLYPAKRPLELFQSLQHSHRRLLDAEHAAIRSSISEALANAKQSYVELHKLDQLVCDAPDEPAARAYIAAFQSLGIVHPYLRLEDTEVAVSIRKIFVAAFDELPLGVQRWFIDLLSDGIDLVVSVPNDSSIRAFLGDDFSFVSIDKPQRFKTNPRCQRHVFPSKTDELNAVISACQDHSVDVVFCKDPAQFYLLEVNLVAKQIPYQVPSHLSFMNTQTVRLLAAYLDFAVDESESALSTVLSILGVSWSRYVQLRMRLGLPAKLSTACYTASTKLPADDRLRDLFSKLSQMVTIARQRESLESQLQSFKTWAADLVPEHERCVLDMLLDFVQRDSSLTSASLRSLLYTSIQRSDSIGPVIQLVSEIDAATFDSAWLHLGPADDRCAEAIVSQALKIVNNDVISSRVA